MTGELRAERLRATLRLFNRYSGEDLVEAMINEVIQNGGTWIDPASTRTPATHLFEISLHEICARAFSVNAAIHGWAEAAKRQLAAATPHEDVQIALSA